MSNKNWGKSPWTISIISGIVPFICSIIYDFIKDKPILTTIWFMFKLIGKFIWRVLNFDVKIMWLLIGLFFILLVLYIIDKFSKSEILKPDFYDYIEDKFNKWNWSWEWQLSESKKSWTIFNLLARCPICNTPMIDSSSFHHIRFNCPRCEYHASDSECDSPHKVEKIILDNIDRKRKEKQTIT